MARIRIYDVATSADITNEDFLLGNDRSATNDSVITKRFNLSDLKDFILLGQDIDIIGQVPRNKGVMVDPTVNGGLTRLPITINETPILEDIPLIGTDLPHQGRYLLDGTSSTIFLTDFEGAYYLPDFVGSTVTYTTTLSGATEYTAVITAYNGFRDDTNGMIQDSFSIDVGPSETDNALTSLTISGVNGAPAGTELSIELSHLTVNGTTNLLGQVNVGTDNSRTEMHVHGTVNFDEGSEGIVFGPVDGDSPGMSTTTFTVDNQGNLLINGADNTQGGTDFPSWTFSSTIDVNIESTLTTENINVGGDITITNENDDSSVTITSGGISTVNADGTAGNPIAAVTANEPGTLPVTAQLSSVQIGDRNYTLPELSAGVAEALPGLNEDLEGSPTPFTTGTFFIGIEQTSGVSYQGAPAEDVTTIALSIAANVTAFDLGDDGDADVTAFEALRDLREVDNREQIFFLESTDTTTLPATVGDIIPDTVDVYEVIAYDTITNVATFGKLGSGTINISTESFTVSSSEVTFSEIPPEAFDNNVHEFVTIDNNNLLSKSPLSISGAANGARYTGDGEADQGLVSLEFTGHNATADTGVMVVDTTGSFNVRPRLDAGPVTAVTGDLLVLRPIAGDATINLPSGNVKDSIRIINTSTVNDDGTLGATTGTWEIAPFTNQTIMGATSTDPTDADYRNLVLNDPTASFELVYTGDGTVGDMGWIIIGIN